MPQFTSYDGTRLACRTTGEGEPLVCLPGGPMRHADYLGDLGGLAAHRTLTVLHPRGTGDSARPADPATYRCDRQVADVEALRVHLGLERMDLLAHSAGGNLALLYAAAHPERVSSLVLVTPGLRAVGITVSDEEWDEATAVFRGQPWYAGTRAALDALGPESSLADAYAAAAPLAYGRWDDAARAHDAAGRFNWEAVAAFYADGAFRPEATRAALAAVTAPVLVVAGEYDGGPTPARAAEAAALLPHAELVVQRGAGHFPWVDDPGALRRPIAAFLDPEVRSLTVDGVRIAYRAWGDATAPPVVLVHGRGGSAAEWTPIARELAADRRVYAVDLAGHGLSDHTGPYGFDVYRDQLRGFLTGLGLAGADVVAHSMGGVAAYLLASAEPELIGRLVVEDAPVLLPPRTPFAPVERPDGELPLDWAVVTATDAQKNDPDPGWYEGLAAVKAPTLVVAGGENSHIPQERVALLVDRIPDSRLVTIETGHLIHQERPDEFVAALREFGI
ncbi:alpha/beta hydrolase [Streptomyces sp. HUAS MG47]|uniref:alpha/beta fold hydrolase n=1 Tax=Streptomyces solicamelliae TaxID=3231716 RepID=UPI00387813FC